MDPIQWLDGIIYTGLPSSSQLTALLTRFVPPPDGMDAATFLGCPDCYADQVSVEDWDPVVATDALEAEIVDVLREAQALVDASPHLTRLFTTMDATEMTVDPLFVFNLADPAHPALCPVPTQLAAPRRRGVLHRGHPANPAVLEERGPPLERPILDAPLPFPPRTEAVVSVAKLREQEVEMAPIQQDPPVRDRHHRDVEDPDGATPQHHDPARHDLGVLRTKGERRSIPVGAEAGCDVPAVNLPASIWPEPKDVGVDGCPTHLDTDVAELPGPRVDVDGGRVENQALAVAVPGAVGHGDGPARQGGGVTEEHLVLPGEPHVPLGDRDALVVGDPVGLQGEGAGHAGPAPRRSRTSPTR